LFITDPWHRLNDKPLPHEQNSPDFVSAIVPSKVQSRMLADLAFDDADHDIFDR
jgi:hypothetical protein